MKTVSNSVSVVALGNFNPKIFTPAWLLKYNLIKNEDYDFAIDQEKDNFVNVPDVSRINFEWGILTVNPMRFVVELSDESYSLILKDLIFSIFNILEHCPVKFLGLNYSEVFEFPNEKVYKKIGDYFSPKKVWDNHLKEAGVLNMTLQSERLDDNEGLRNLIVNALPDFKVRLRLNDHLKLDDNEPITSMLEYIETYWESSLKESKKTILEIMGEVNKHASV